MSVAQGAGRIVVREVDIQRAVMDVLAARGFVVFRRNVVGTRIYEHKGRRRAIRGEQRGAADIYGWHRRDGRHIEVEVKAPGKRPSPWQQAWLGMCSRSGALSFWTDSVADLEENLELHGYRGNW